MKYDDIQIGTKEKLIHSVTQSDIEKFVDLTGDDNKLHVDSDFAAKTSFKKPVVHGMIGASFISTIIGTKLPGDGALWFSQTLEFLLPVRVGDVITVSAEVIKKYDRDHIVELNVEIQNQNRQVVTRGISKVKVIEQIVQENEENTVEAYTKVALIVGATGGIGRATCIQLANDGFNLVIHYFKNKDKALSIQEEILKLGIKAVIFKADISEEKQINELINYSIRKFNRVDLLVNCAASAIPPIKVTDLLWSDFLHQMELNIKVNLQLIHGVLPSMINNKFGKIITIGSVYTDKPNLNLTHYTTAKSALEGFTKSLAKELASRNVRVNAIAPGFIETDMTKDLPLEGMAEHIPLKRLGKPEDIAKAVKFLAVDADYITGQVLQVDGGLVI